MRTVEGWRRWTLLFIGGGFAAAAAVAQPPATPARLILIHGRIYTEDPSTPWVEALAVGGDRILAVGADADLLRLKGAATRVIDLEGRLVTPGLIDSHVHFTDGGRYLKNVALRDATSLAEIGARIARYAAAHPQTKWIQGEGWSYGYPDLPNGEFHKELLDPVSAGHPVFLDSSMAHAAWVNSAALRLAGITRHTPNPAGGEIVRDAAGEPTGWLKEDAAIRLVQDKIPPPTAADTRDALVAAIHEANRLGLTRVDSAGGDYPALDALTRLERQGALTLRISVADWIEPPGLTAAHLRSLEGARARHRGSRLVCCVAKFIMDGVIESHTAFLPAGYADQPAQTGMRFFEPQAYKDAVRELNEHGFQVYTHAIGDGAIKLALDAYAASTPGARNRIEHAEMPDPEDIPRFGRLGVVASMQPLMIYPRDEWKGMEGLWERYAGARFVPTAFPLRSLLDSHATLAFGTDWPVVQLNPLLGIRNAVLRQSSDGLPAGGYVPAQRISATEALRAYTLDAAYASRAETQEGSLTPGKFADLVVFSANFLEGNLGNIGETKVFMTLVGGDVVYSAGRPD